MKGSRQSETILHRVASLSLHGANMSRLHLRPPTSISKPEARHGAPEIIGLPHFASERDISIGTPRQPFQNGTCKMSGFLMQRRMWVIAVGLDLLQVLRQAQVDNSRELGFGQSSHRKLNGSSFLGGSIQFAQRRFQRAPIHQARNFSIEGQETTRLHQSKIPTVCPWLGYDLRYLRRREIAPRACLHRFIIDNPVTDSFRYCFEVPLGKVVNDIRLIFVNRVSLMQ